MRGRTNASNGGIFLNATTDDFEVATGNTIVVGDFVEYHYDTEEKSLEASSYSDRVFVVDANAKLYIGVFSGYICLFNYTNNLITILASYNTVAVTMPLFQYNATTYIDSNGNVYSVDILNNTISLLKNIGNTYKYKVENYFVTYDFTYVSSGDTLTIHLFDATDLSNITEVDSELITVSNYGNFHGRDLSIQGYCVYQNGIAFYLAGSLSGSTRYARNCVVYVDIDLTNGSITEVTFEDLSKNSGTSTITYGITVYNDKALGGRYIPFMHRMSYQGTIKYDYLLYDVLSKSSISDSVRTASDAIEDTEYIYFFSTTSSSEVRLRIINKTTNVLYDYEETNSYAKTPISYNKWIQMRASNNRVLYTPFEIINNKIVIGEVTDTVQEWQGGLNPMGVAKQSGNAGDTIAVYIPQVNS